jgi:hypothetical protein
MAVERWISAPTGQGLTYTAAFNNSDLAALPNGSAVLSSIADITNGTYLDVFAAISCSMGTLSVASPNFVGIYFYPLNQDGTTYGDGYFSSGSQQAKVPSATYWVGNIIVGTTGNTAVVGTLDRIILPPRSGRFLFYNQLGATLPGSANTVKYETYDRSVA